MPVNIHFREGLRNGKMEVGRVRGYIIHLPRFHGYNEEKCGAIRMLMFHNIPLSLLLTVKTLPERSRCRREDLRAFSDLLGTTLSWLYARDTFSNFLTRQ